MSTLVVVPQSPDAGTFIELSATATASSIKKPAMGKVFRKQILNYGDLLYPKAPGGKVKIDDSFADRLIENFNAGVCPIVQVPKADAKNQHTEDVDRNMGEVIGLSKENGKIYADIDVRTDDASKVGKTLLGTSAMMNLDYIDTKTMTPVGPTLLHVLVTNRPYVTDLEDFSEVIAASADGTNEAVLLAAPTKGDPVITLDEAIAYLRDEHKIDVPALQKKAADADKAVALSATIQDQLSESGLLKLSNGQEATADDLIGAVAEAGQKIVALSATVETLVENGKKTEAETRVDSLVREGRILSKDKDAQVELLLSNSELFERLLPEKPLIKLSAPGEDFEFGREPGEAHHQNNVQDEIDRIANSDAAKAYIRES